MANGLGPPLDGRQLGGRVRGRQVQGGEGVTGRAVGDPQVGATPPTGRSRKSSRLKPLPRGPPVVYRSRTTQSAGVSAAWASSAAWATSSGERPAFHAAAIAARRSRVARV